MKTWSAFAIVREKCFFFKVAKDKKRRRLFYGKEIYLKILKFLFLVLSIKGIKGILYKKLLSKYNIHNLCVSTGKSKGLFRKYKVSRITLRGLSRSLFFLVCKKQVDSYYK